MDSKRYLLLTVLISVAAVPLRGQSSGMDFLTVGPSTLALSLNEAVTAYPIGASSLYSNPANLVMESESSLAGDLTFWIGDFTNAHVAANIKRRNHAFAFGLLSSSADDFEARSRPGPSEGSFSATFFSAAAAFAYRFDRLSLGATVHFLREEIFENTAAGYAFNVGLATEWWNGRLRFAGALNNLGAMNELVDQATDLPTRLKFGLYGQVIRFLPAANPDLPIWISMYADYIQPLEEGSENRFTDGAIDEGFVNAGISVTAAEVITLRAGYKTGSTERHLAFGVGVKVDQFSFNYALVPFSTGFGTVHSVGLQYYFR